jgi:hypothetical protein
METQMPLLLGKSSCNISVELSRKTLPQHKYGKISISVKVYTEQIGRQ